MKELLRDVLGKFALPVLAAAVIGLAGIFIGTIQATSHLDSRLARVEEQIEKHEKSLNRDFARHEQTVTDIVHRTEDQERRLTRLEAMFDQMQQLLNEIRADVKILLRGKGSGQWPEN